MTSWRLILTLPLLAWTLKPWNLKLMACLLPWNLKLPQLTVSSANINPQMPLLEVLRAL